MVKDAFDCWLEWAEKPLDSPLTIPAHIHDAVMRLPPKHRFDRAKVNEAVRIELFRTPIAEQLRSRSDEVPAPDCVKLRSNQ